MNWFPSCSTNAWYSIQNAEMKKKGFCDVFTSVFCSLLVLKKTQVPILCGLVDQGCESSSSADFLIFEHFLLQNFNFFLYFQPIFAIFTQFHTVFPHFLSVASHTPGRLLTLDLEWILSLFIQSSSLGPTCQSQVRLCLNQSRTDKE